MPRMGIAKGHRNSQERCSLSVAFPDEANANGVPCFEIHVKAACGSEPDQAAAKLPAVPQPASHYFSSQPALTDAQLARSSPLRVFARGHFLQFLTAEGVFSRRGLDEGSRLLIETISLPDGAVCCDLGCGWGAVGAYIAREFPTARLFAGDINARAVALTRHNWGLNQIEGAGAWCGDGLGAVRDEIFDVIACNPPIRAGNAAIDAMFEDAHRTLKPSGALWVVIRTAQGAKSWQKKLAARFGACETVVMKGGYRVLKAVKSE